MHYPNRLLKVATCFALALMLAGCARFMGKLDVDLSALKECRRLTPDMKVPEIDRDTDYRALSAGAGGTIKKGNKAIVRRNKCDDGVIAKYKSAGT